MKKLFFVTFLAIFVAKIASAQTSQCMKITYFHPSPIIGQPGKWSVGVGTRNFGGTHSFGVFCKGVEVWCQNVYATGDSFYVKPITCDCTDSSGITFANFLSPDCQGYKCDSSAVLPVGISSFTSGREGQSVVLNWQTASESNNAGFAVERSTDGGNIWTQVGFVNSAAPNGNSSSLLDYSYSDANSEKGITQYRIKQTDWDGKYVYSSIRAVAGIDQTINKILVYPNPSHGAVNVLFNQPGEYNISLTDLSGKLLHIYWVSGNNLQISGLAPGMYFLKFNNSEVKKIIVQ